VSDELRPREGARFLLERRHVTGARAEYRAAIFTPEQAFEGTAVLDDAGGVELAIDGAPAELVDMLHMLARLTARAAAKRRDDGLPAWPARVLRWRGPGRGE
jgi:hypothetical protein